MSGSKGPEGTYTDGYDAGLRDAKEGHLAQIENVPLFDESDRIVAMNGTVREPRTMADAAEALRTRIIAAIRAAA